jgi:hypothetical protein
MVPKDNDAAKIGKSAGTRPRPSGEEMAGFEGINHKVVSISPGLKSLA